MIGTQANNPLHGKTLEMILNELLDHYGWEELGSIIPVNCFNIDPSIKSSLTFLRKTPWARKRVEDLYLDMVS
ncbi:MAG: DUF2132 domain-containing protein [Cytophagales bacterium]|nr:DUF2132 domain-containing protein [Cytophaga sp.]